LAPVTVEFSLPDFFPSWLSDFWDRLSGGDANVVAEAVGLDSRVGQKYLRPAIAFGGPCFPRDNIALAAFAKSIGARADLAEATHAINLYQTERLLHLITSQDQVKKIGILGLAYKPGTYVVEESQGIYMANLLIEKGYEVCVFDPQAMVEAKKELRSDVHIASSTSECVSQSELLVLMIPWPEFTQELYLNLTQMGDSNKIVIDCWRFLEHHKFFDICQLLYLGKGESSSRISTILTTT